jgi:hypothetical protein
MLNSLNESIKELGEYTVGENNELVFKAKISDDSKGAVEQFKEEVEDASSDRTMYFDFSQPFAAAQSLVKTVNQAAENREVDIKFHSPGLQEVLDKVEILKQKVQETKN